MIRSILIIMFCRGKARLATTLIIMLMCLCTGVLHAEPFTAQQILEKNYLANRMADSTAEIRMELYDSNGKKRVRQLTVFSKLQGAGMDAMYALFFRAPADIKGTGTLLIQRSKAEDDLWIYLPAARKTRRLFSDNKRDSFMGSDLSYGDILGHRPSDWHAKLLREDTLDGTPVYVIEATPVSPAIQTSSGYAKQVLTIDKTNFIALKTDYQDDTGQPLKTISVSDVKALGETGKYQFMKVQADQLQTGHHTTLIYEQFHHCTGLGDDVFTQRALEKGIP